MEYNNLIQEFIDGSIEKGQEDKLFMEMSSNEELRAELRQNISIEKAFNRKLSSFSPSAQSTVSIFSKLGFSRPASIVPQPVAGGVLKKGLIILGKYSQGIIGGLICTILTSSLFVISQNNGNHSFSSKTSNINQIVKHSANNESSRSLVPVVSSSENDKKVTIVRKGLRLHQPANTSQASTTPPKDITNIEKVQNLPVPVNTIPENKLENKDLAANLINDAKFEKTSTINANFHFNKYQPVPVGLKADYLWNKVEPYSPIGLAIELRQSEYWTIGQNDVQATDIPNFNNFGAALLYSVSDNWTVGFDVRQEHFYQKFQGSDTLNNLFLYRQNPNYVSYSLLSRYKFINTSIFQSFVQGMGGVTATGGVGRLAIGVEFTPSPGYSFMLSLEGSALAYLHQNSWYYSPKIGLNYGVGFHF